jgi:nucleoside phosphorylase
LARFDAFSERGPDCAGQEATNAVAGFLLTCKSGDRITPRALASELELDVDDVADLLELATSHDVRLLVDSSQVRCPKCEMRIDQRPLLDQLEAEGEAECPDCHQVIDDLAGLRPELRYSLTDEATAEAAAWQRKQDMRPRLRAVVLCAIRDELVQVRRQMELHSEVQEVSEADGGVYLQSEFSGSHVDWEIRAAATAQTNYAAASGTVAAVMTFDPQMVVYLGIAGSIDKDVRLGDVVAADRVHDYEVGKERAGEGGQEGTYEERPLQQQSTFQLLKWAETVSTSDAWKERIQLHDEALATDPSVHLEPIAAGSKVVANKDSSTARLIAKAAPRAVAVEMEGAGFLGAVHRLGDIEGILIRGISDQVDDKPASDASGWRHQAAANAAAFAFEMFARYYPAPKRGTGSTS